MVFHLKVSPGVVVQKDKLSDRRQGSCQRAKDITAVT
jgi:hypothetical protein